MRVESGSIIVNQKEVWYNYSVAVFWYLLFERELGKILGKRICDIYDEP